MAITPSHHRQAPIGLFDSGVGGLTVAREIIRQLPHESLIYLGDTARTPYGTKAGATVKRFSLECVNQLASMNIKALVVACNTASAYALPTLKRQFKFPVIGVVKPGARAALNVNRSTTIGVIGTSATIQSQAYVKTIKQLDPKSKVVSHACPLLVPLVENGWLDGPICKKIIEHYLNPLLEKDIKQLILGCTHYPALKPLISKVCGKKVTIIDSAQEVTKELKTVLEKQQLLNLQKKAGRIRFLVTDVPQPFINVGTTLMGKKIQSIQRIVLPEMCQ